MTEDRQTRHSRWGRLLELGPAQPTQAQSVHGSGLGDLYLDTSGKIVGVTVTSIDASQPYASVLNVTVWQDTQ